MNRQKKKKKISEQIDERLKVADKITEQFFNNKTTINIVRVQKNPITTNHDPRIVICLRYQTLYIIPNVYASITVLNLREYCALSSHIRN